MESYACESYWERHNIFRESLSSGFALKNALQSRGVWMNQPSVTHHALYFLFYKKWFLRLKKGRKWGHLYQPCITRFGLLFNELVQIQNNIGKCEALIQSTGELGWLTDFGWHLNKQRNGLERNDGSQTQGVDVSAVEFGYFYRPGDLGGKPKQIASRSPRASVRRPVLSCSRKFTWVISTTLLSCSRFYKYQDLAREVNSSY